MNVFIWSITTSTTLSKDEVWGIWMQEDREVKVGARPPAVEEDKELWGVWAVELALPSSRLVAPVSLIIT